MKKKEGFEMSSVCGEKFLMAEGVENIDNNIIITLNETAAFLWEAMGNEEFTIDQLLEKLTEAYEVSADDAKYHIERLIADMQKAGVIC